MTDPTQAAIDDLKAAGAANTATIGKAVAAFKSFADQIEASKDDPEQIAAVAAQMRLDAAALEAALPAVAPPTP